ncbi:MAG: conjugal transfer protein TraX [Clostridia bacterium]|nr:conjugal transfer protein TraX [Clostridia bacterium]
MSEKKGLDRLVLKSLACFLMLLDHIGYKFWAHGAVFLYFRMAGRAAFPIFAFMLAEGASKSKNKPRYLLRLLLFGLITEPFFDRCFYKTWFHAGSLNVMFTLALGLIAIFSFRLIKKEAGGKTGSASFFITLAALICPVMAAIAAELLGTDYGMYGVALMFLYGITDRSSAGGKALTVAVTFGFGARFLLLYELKNLLAILSLTAAPEPPAQWLLQQIYAAAALIPLLLYNGSRGPEIRSRAGKAAVKYGFYAFYPVHLLILILISG